MANFKEWFNNFITGGEEEDDDEERYGDGGSGEEDENEPVTTGRSSKVTSFDARRPARTGGNIQNAKVMSINTKMEVVISNPHTLEEASSVCEDLRAKKTTVVNLEDVERDMAQRISDFLSGACYALEGSIQLISERIFIIGPINVDITGEFKDELKASGIKFSAAMWK